ncbi:MAG: hypothetical protein ABIP20_14445 [Chthoniobacteraceae bacterium]
MKLPISLLLFASAISVSALDLTPSFINATADGIVIRRPYFADGAKKYSVTLDMETELTPYEDGSLFRFTKFNHGEMRLRPSSFGTTVMFGPDTLDRYEEAARKLLPQLAEMVTLIEQVKNPWPINHWQSHRFIFTYATSAGEVSESITFLNITPSQQVIVQVYAMAKDFPDVSGRAYDTIRRWHELDPKTVVRGN